MPAAYIIADVAVTDEQKMAEYRQWSSRAIADHGAEILVRGGAPAALEGDWAPTRIVVLKFAAGRAAALAFYDSQTYAQARRVREGAGRMRMIVVDGPE
ncbi:MAG: DUF1330 domain-containing protein [Burkholderiales bacterium]|nr:DUF1330 domain-containing protein [Burkholderiales bacterium]